MIRGECGAIFAFCSHGFYIKGESKAKACLGARDKNLSTGAILPT